MRMGVRPCARHEPPAAAGRWPGLVVLRAAAGVRAAREGQLSGVIHRLLLLRRCAACGCHHRAISHYFIPFHPSSAVGGSTLASSPQHTNTPPPPPLSHHSCGPSAQLPASQKSEQISGLRRARSCASVSSLTHPPRSPIHRPSACPSGVGAPRLVVSSSTTPTPSHRLPSAPRDLQSPLRPPPAHNTLSPRSLGLTATTHSGVRPFHHAGSSSTRS